MTLDKSYHILGTAKLASAMSMLVVVSALDLHPMCKDQGSDFFYSNGAEWWTTQAACCRDRSTAHAIISRALVYLSHAVGVSVDLSYGECRPLTPFV